MTTKNGNGRLREFVSEKEKALAVLLEKYKHQADSPQEAVQEFDVPEFHKDMPLLNAICTAHTAPGSDAEGTTIVLWFESDGVHAILNPKALGAKAFFEGESLLAVFKAMEGFLSLPSPRWRNESGQRQPRAARPKQGTSKPK